MKVLAGCSLGLSCSQCCSKNVTAASLKYKLSLVQVMSVVYRVCVCMCVCDVLRKQAGLRDFFFCVHREKVNQCG